MFLPQYTTTHSTTTTFATRFWISCEMVLLYCVTLCVATFVLSFVGFVIVGTFWTIPFWLKVSLWGSFIGGLSCFVIGIIIPKPHINACWNRYALDMWGEFRPVVASKIVAELKQEFGFAEFFIEPFMHL